MRLVEKKTLYKHIWIHARLLDICAMFGEDFMSGCEEIPYGVPSSSKLLPKGPYICRTNNFVH